MTVSLEMVVPGLLGYWIGSKFGLMPFFVLLGFGLGMVLGMWHLLKMTSRDRQRELQDKTSS